MKVFEDGRTGLGWREAKGKRAVNHEECASAYEQWWREWVAENRLIEVLVKSTGLSDIFGRPGYVCQATVLWKLRNEVVKK